MRLVDHPVLCNYYLTYRCNAKCGFCDIWEQPSPYVNLDHVEANLLDLKVLGVKVIDFTGGEPLLHRQLPEILTLAKSLGFITTITTNALLYPKRASLLVGLIDMLHFSLDSADSLQHDRMRGVRCFDTVLASIDIARELGERPDILFTIFSHNLEQIGAVYEKISKPNNLVLILNPAFDYNNIDAGENLTTKQLEELRQWGSKKLVYLNASFISLIEDGGNHISRPVCRAGSSTIVISAHNELISPCYHLNNEQFPLANDLLSRYRQAETQAALKKAGKYDACEGCTINCYMQPSFATETSKYFWQALPSTLKYNRMKGTWKRLLSNSI